MNINALQSAYSIPTPWDFDFLASRSHNHLALIRSADDQEYVLCTYSSSDPVPVQYIQHVLHSINAAALPFRLPIAIPTSLGAYVEVQNDGYRQWVATLTPLLVGDPPSPEDTTAAFRAGIALGQLTLQLALVSEPSIPCTNPAVGALTQIHPAS